MSPHLLIPTPLLTFHVSRLTPRVSCSPCSCCTASPPLVHHTTPTAHSSLLTLSTSGNSTRYYTKTYNLAHLAHVAPRHPPNPQSPISNLQSPNPPIPASSPLLSIIINNYNYGRYLPQAIDSALQQTYPHTEVIVVDDGSTDNSRQIITSYGRRIHPILKTNGGQASAFNAGFAASQGDIIIFLDADDTLRPEIGQTVVHTFQANPTPVKVQYRLALIDETGAPTGAIMPPPNRPLPNGNLRRHVLTFPDDITWLPTSGNAFAASALRQIFPVPEAAYPICADYYLLNLPPLLGPIASLDQVGGCYRVHPSNAHHTHHFNLDHTRRTIRLTQQTHRYIQELAQSQGETAAPNSITYLTHRLLSLKLAPDQHPIPADTLTSLLRQGIRAAFTRFDRPLSTRLLYTLWFLLLTLAPRPLTRRLAQKFL